MNLDEISTQLLYTTVPVYSKNSTGKESLETGFAFSVNQNDNSSIPLLIIHFDPIDNPMSGYAEFHISRDGMPSKEVVRVQFDSGVISEGKLNGVDLVAIPLADVLIKMQNSGIPLYYKSIDLSLIPNNDLINSISSKSVTATPIWNEYQGKKEFLIENYISQEFIGSPVFVYDNGVYSNINGIVLGKRALFVGVLVSALKGNGNNGEEKTLKYGQVINCMAFFDGLSQYINIKTGIVLNRV